MNAIRRSLLFALLLPALSRAGAPAAPPGGDAKKQREQQLEEAAKHLRSLERYLAEWGHASATGLFILPDLPANKSASPFGVEGNQSYATTVNNIRINSQGKAGNSDKQSLSLESPVPAAPANSSPVFAGQGALLPNQPPATNTQQPEGGALPATISSMSLSE